jgi:hypothetical protein
VAATKKPRGPNKPKGSAAAGGGDSQAPSGGWGGLDLNGCSRVGDGNGFMARPWRFGVLPVPLDIF